MKYQGNTELVRRVLIDYWDPIGVKDVPQAQDEYDTYVPGVLRLLQQGASADELAQYLSDIASIEMGLMPVENRNRVAAEKLARLAG